MFLDINIGRAFHGPPNLEDGEQSSLEIVMQGTGAYMFQFFQTKREFKRTTSSMSRNQHTFIRGAYHQFLLIPQMCFKKRVILAFFLSHNIPPQ